MVLSFNYACGVPTQTPTATWTVTSTPTDTDTPSSTDTFTPPPSATATATPTQPVLQSVALGPNPAYGGQTIVMSYTVWSPSQQVVSLGADMAPAGTGQYLDDQPNNAQVTVNPGLNTVTRIFNLGSRIGR